MFAYFGNNSYLCHRKTNEKVYPEKQRDYGGLLVDMMSTNVLKGLHFLLHPWSLSVSCEFSIGFLAVSKMLAVLSEIGTKRRALFLAILL